VRIRIGGYTDKDNSTEDGRQKNRRISLRVTDQQAAV
jgi:flagellar motor protein MotB